MTDLSISRRKLLIGGVLAAAGTTAAFGRVMKVDARADSYTPASQPFSIADLPMLDDKQAGHLRHLRNISDQQPGVWKHMKGPIDHMGGGTGPALYKVVPHSHFALMLGFYNRLPAAPGVFRATSHRFINQMLDKEVWGYWRLMSTSSNLYDPGLKQERQPWSDPVVTENIMYSGRLAMMLGLHATLFNDNRYETPDSVVFDWDVPFSGGPAKFKYSANTLNDRIYWQMVESGHLGIPCEPNSVFLVCNQYGLISLRLRDVRQGTSVADMETSAFRAAWERKGWIEKDGHLTAFYKPNQDKRIPIQSPLWDFYTATYMSAWNPGFVKAQYPAWAKYAFRQGPNGTLSPWPADLLPAVKAAVDGGRPVSGIDVRGAKLSHIADIGQMAAGAAELGDRKSLDGMLAHLDQFCKPTWENGGLFYPRNDERWDAAGNQIMVDPWTGSAGSAHARLTVEGGLWNIYNKPWDKAHFAQPAITAVSDDLDMLRAIYLPDRRALVWTVRTWHRQEAQAETRIGNAVNNRPWKLYRDGQAIASGSGGQVASGSVTGIRFEGAELVVPAAVRSTSDFVMAWA